MHKFATLIAPECATYKNKKVRCLFVENICEYVENLLKTTKPFIAKKKAKVEYEICQKQKQIKTFAPVIVNGFKYKIFETENTANVGDFVVLKNGDYNREYVAKLEVAKKRYAFNELKQHGIALPKEKIQTFVEVPQNIAFVSPWGEIMFLLAGGFLNITSTSIYAIQKLSFDHTYERIKNK